MDKELQNLGIFGIWRESFKMVYTWRTIFLRLSLTLILPLSFMYLAYIQICFLPITNISLKKNTLANTMNVDTTLMTLLRELAKYSLIPVASIFFVGAFSLLSTSAVTYTAACIYSNKKVTFKDVFCVVPKVWKRLMATHLCIVAIVLVYHFVFSTISIFILISFPLKSHGMERYNLLRATLLILYLVGFCYMSVFWQLANVVSVLEESYGFQALRRSKVLMKGRRRVSRAVSSMSKLCLGLALYLYGNFVVVGRSNVGVFERVGFRVVSLLLLNIFTLLGLVVKTVFYLVCKSYHNEQIDKSAIADHLEVYHGEGYVLLKP